MEGRRVRIQLSLRAPESEAARDHAPDGFGVPVRYREDERRLLSSHGTLIKGA